MYLMSFKTEWAARYPSKPLEKIMPVTKLKTALERVEGLVISSDNTVVTIGEPTPAEPEGSWANLAIQLVASCGDEGMNI